MDKFIFLAMSHVSVSQPENQIKKKAQTVWCLNARAPGTPGCTWSVRMWTLSGGLSPYSVSCARHKVYVQQILLNQWQTNGQHMWNEQTEHCSALGSLEVLLSPSFQELELQAPIAIPKSGEQKLLHFCTTYWIGPLGGACTVCKNHHLSQFVNLQVKKREKSLPFVKTCQLIGKEGQWCFQMLFINYRILQDIMSQSFNLLKM